MSVGTAIASLVESIIAHHHASLHSEIGPALEDEHIRKEIEALDLEIAKMSGIPQNPEVSKDDNGSA